MKAGILELPDLFVVNKADLGPAAQRTARELETGLGLSERTETDWTPPVLLASARDGSGVRAVADALDAHRRHLEQTGRLRERRRRGAEAFVLESLARRYGSFGLERLGGNGAVRERLREGESAFALIAALGAEIEAQLAGARRAGPPA
jgi:LAO/AO transport system kinase